MKIAAAFFLVLTLCLVKPVTASADDVHSGEVGLLGGIANLNNSGGSPFTYGLMADFSLDPSWMLGFQINTLTPNSLSVLGTTYTQGLTNINAAIKYVVGMWNVGVLLGVGMYTTNVPGVSNTSSFIYGLETAYDWNIGGNFSIGPEADVILSSQSGGFTEVDIYAAIKYWF